MQFGAAQLIKHLQLGRQPFGIGPFIYLQHHPPLRGASQGWQHPEQGAAAQGAHPVVPFQRDRCPKALLQGLEPFPLLGHLALQPTVQASSAEPSKEPSTMAKAASCVLAPGTR